MDWEKRIGVPMVDFPDQAKNLVNSIPGWNCHSLPDLVSAGVD